MAEVEAVAAVGSSASTNTSIWRFVTVVADFVVVERRVEVDVLGNSPLVNVAGAALAEIVAFASPKTVTALPFPLSDDVDVPDAATERRAVGCSAVKARRDAVVDDAEDDFLLGDVAVPPILGLLLELDARAADVD
jgi:hypothetical protein